MSLEIEAKMKVADLPAIRSRLAECGAAPAGKVGEVNTFFDTPDRSLLAEDRGLRLRKKTAADGRETFIITHKGPRTHGRLKNREELEVEVDNGPDAAAMLVALGFDRVMSFEKRRESFKLDGCSVELDELPHLGTYVEIEGPSEDAVLKVRDRLGLEDAPIVKASYIALLSSYLQESGLPAQDVRFEEAA